MAAVSRTPTPTPACSPTMQPICDVNIYIVNVSDSFTLEDLYYSLTRYLREAKGQWLDPKQIPAAVLRFFEELDKWLNDYKSEKLGVKEVLEFWRDKVDTLNAQTDADLPEIVISENE